jgi:hypothetical protein
VINTLAPILPTFGCGEAAVKQNLGNCIHELEGADIEKTARYNNYPLWNDEFPDIKEIVLSYCRNQWYLPVTQPPKCARRAHAPLREISDHN